MKSIHNIKLSGGCQSAQNSIEKGAQLLLALKKLVDLQGGSVCGCIWFHHGYPSWYYVFTLGDEGIKENSS